MSWQDYLLSTPAASLSWAADFLPAATALERLRPLLRQWDEEGLEILTSGNATASLEIELSTGFSLRLLPTALVVQFQYRMTLERVRANDLPVATATPSELTEISTLWAQMGTLLSQVLPLILGSERRALTRLSYRSKSEAAFQDIPPGIAWRLEAVGSAWSTPTRKLSVSHSTDLEAIEGDKVTAIHELKLDSPAAPDSVAEVQLEWRRWIEGQGVLLDAQQLLASFEANRLLAVEHFQQFVLVGEGQ